jgi:hypothetical protein
MTFKIEKIKTESNILIGNYYRHSFLKSEIVSTLESYKDKQNRQTNVKATMTEWNIDSFEITNLKNYILDFLNSAYPFVRERNQNFNFSYFWGNVYRMGDYAIEHDHLFNVFSVVYFLKSKIDDSPLIFLPSTTSILPEEGKLVIFPSYIMHKVPKHTSKDTRITLSGNIAIT